MRRRAAAIALAILAGCGGAPPSMSPPSCDVLPTRLAIDARRYGNVDHDDASYQQWTPWRLAFELTASDARVHGRVTMTGDHLAWAFDVAGTLDARARRIELRADSHEPLAFTLDASATRGWCAVTGTAASIDDRWVLGPPFPAQRP